MPKGIIAGSFRYISDKDNYEKYGGTWFSYVLWSSIKMCKGRQLEILLSIIKIPQRILNLHMLVLKEKHSLKLQREISEKSATVIYPVCTVPTHLGVHIYEVI